MTKNVFMKVKDTSQLEKTLRSLEKNGYIMASDFDKSVPTAEKLLHDFKKYYRGTLVLHTFFNAMTGNKELSYSNIATIKSYPQYKDFEKWESLDFDNATFYFG